MLNPSRSDPTVVNACRIPGWVLIQTNLCAMSVGVHLDVRTTTIRTSYPSPDGQDHNTLSLSWNLN
jgi:hypothetical protein